MTYEMKIRHMRLFLPAMAWLLTSLWLIISSESIILSERKEQEFVPSLIGNTGLSGMVCCFATILSLSSKAVSWEQLNGA